MMTSSLARAVSAFAGGVALSAMATGMALADPAILYEPYKFDASFNEAAWSGAERFKTETGISYGELEVATVAQREQAIRQFAQRGANPIVLPGFNWESALATVAPEFPETSFVIIDTVVDLPNVRSVVFKEQEGSYLVGALAGMFSKSGVIGVVPAFPFDVLEAFACGYKQGAKAVNPEIEVLEAYVGTGFEGFENTGAATEVAKSLLDRNADVLFQVAAGAGAGVMQAAADAGKWSIGVDSNQNALHPGSVLTSMLKRVDVATYEAMKDFADGNFTYGTQVLGLAEEGVGAAFDDNNASLVTPEMRARIDELSAKIISGEIAVHDFRTDQACPA